MNSGGSYLEKLAIMPLEYSEDLLVLVAYFVVYLNLDSLQLSKPPQLPYLNLGVKLLCFLQYFNLF
jgi:hypothetical protein